jgi:hypothetical protein
VLTEAASVAPYIYHLSNMYLFYAFTVIETMVLTLAVNRLLTKRIPIFVLAIIAVIIMPVTYIDFRFIAGLQHFNSVSRSVECVLLLGVALYALYDLMKFLPAPKVQQLPLFWMAFAMLLYFAGDLVLFVITGMPQAKSFWILHSVLNIIFNVLLAKVVVCFKPTTNLP